MRTWLPAGDILFNMIIDYLPSPIIAQKYRTEKLYSGPLDSNEAFDIQNCNPNGVMSMYISKMIPIKDKNSNCRHFIAFGRVFSGKIKNGQNVRIIDSNNDKIDTNNCIKKIQRISLMMGKYTETLLECSSGNVCGISGIDQYILKSGTLTDSDNMYPFHTMKFSVSPIVQVAISCKNKQDVQELIEGLKLLSKSDPLIKIINKNGQYIMGTAGELHLDVSIKDLQNDYMNGKEILISEPIISYSETIQNCSGDNNNNNNNNYPNICTSKSQNKLNRLYVNSKPLDINLVNQIEKGDIIYENILNPNNIQILKNFNYSLNEIKKNLVIWLFT